MPSEAEQEEAIIRYGYGVNCEEEEDEELYAEPDADSIFAKLQPRRSKGELAEGSRGFPGEVTGGGSFTLKLGAHAVDVMNRMAVAFFDCEKALENEETWRAWCDANACPTMAENYDMFVDEMREHSSRHNLFQALRMRYNVDVRISEMHEGRKGHFFYDITLSGDTRESLLAALHNLTSYLPKKFKIYLSTPCDFHMNGDMTPEMAVEQWITEADDGEEEEEAEAEEQTSQKKK